jgi:large conductance mechanosensitive channel
VSLTGESYATLADAQKAAAPTINYGIFLNTLFEFLIVAFVIFLLVRQINRLVPPPVTAPAEPQKACQFCASQIPLAAKRCPHCTSTLA